MPTITDRCRRFPYALLSTEDGLVSDQAVSLVAGVVGLGVEGVALGVGLPIGYGGRTAAVDY